MTREEFNTLINDIGTCEDETQRREMLTSLRETVSSDFDRLEELEETNAQLTTDNETLRSANMKLFLRVGDEREPEPPLPTPAPKDKLKFEDLFNDKGGLK